MIYFFGWLTALIISLASFYRIVYILATGADKGPIFSQLLLCVFCGSIVLYTLKRTIKRWLARHARRKKDRQRLNQLQLLPPNAALPPIQTENIIILEPGEYAYASVDAVLMVLTETETTSFSGSGAKIGNSLSVSGTTRTSWRSRWEAAATGELIITPNRLVYSGNTSTFIFKLEDLLGVVPTDGGFTINGQYDKHVIKIESSTQRQIFDQVFRRVMQQRRQAEQQAFA